MSVPRRGQQCKKLKVIRKLRWGSAVRNYVNVKGGWLPLGRNFRKGLIVIDA